MPITIGSNIEGLRALRQLDRSSARLSKALDRLSSGQRIRTASDDAAGLAIASKLQADSRVYSQAIRNANDGLSMLSIAEGALSALSGISTRIAELAEQSANGTYGSSQRQAADREAQALASEFSRILQTTSFNGSNLLGSTANRVTLQVGLTSEASSRLDVSITAPTRAAGDGTLGDPINLTTSANAAGKFEVGDLNNDGKADILFLSGGGRIGYLLGNGDGSFNAHVTFTTGYTHTGESADLADINHDGKLDIITTNPTGLVVTLGNGDGTFRAGVQYAQANTPDTAVLGDFNGDGNLDIATVQPDLGDLYILIGNGNGSFKAGVSYPTSTGARQVAIGDLNEDGRLDIFTAFNEQVYLGAGDGTFTVGTSISPQLSQNRSPELADLNNDGHLDLLLGDSGAVVGVAFGNGNGTFRSLVTYNVTSTTSFNENSLELVDMNGDGSLDIISAGGSSHSIGILINNGNGTFRAQVSYAAVGDPLSVVSGDINGDGVLDIVTGGYGGNTAQVFITNTNQVAGLQPFSLLTAAGSRTALDDMMGTVDSISRSLATIGAHQSRISSAVNNLMVSRENATAAAARITDADVAEESANLTREQTLLQAGAAVLAQAKLAPSLALKLLA